MSTETTVLLLEADSLPSALEEQLTKREVFVEHASGGDVAQMLPMVGPDLVVQPGSLDIEPTIRALQNENIQTPLVVIADRARLRELREGPYEAILALIPQDLPVAAIAHRLATMARRAAEGVPLEPEPLLGESLEGPPGEKHPPEKAQTAANLAQKVHPPAERGSLAPAPLAPRQQVKIVDPEETTRREAEQLAREEAALLEAEAQQRAVEASRQKNTEQAEERKRQAAEKHRAEAEARTTERSKQLEDRRKEQALRLEERKREQELKREERRAEQERRAQDRASLRVKAPRTSEEDLEQTTQAVDISAFASELDKQARGEEKLPGARGFSAVKKSEDLSVIMPLPVDMRVDLAPQAATTPIRLALLDTDLTRADAVAAALRDRGMKIHPVTPDPGRTRWPMLRRFAPQGLVVDEKSMARGAAEWVETFRGDPFLRHVPVVLVRFSRVFDEVSGKVSLGTMLPVIEHLGREEFALLGKLKPGRCVDLWLSQVAPFRLVEMMTKEDRNTRLDCKSDTERMVWHLGPGYAGRGKLADLKTDAPKQRLSPSEALLWLLSHDDCQVTVHEHAEPLAHASESVDAEGLLREMTEALGAPSRHESVRPGALSRRQTAPSAPDISPLPSPPEVAALANSTPVSLSTEPSEMAELSSTLKQSLSGEMRANVLAHIRATTQVLKRSYMTYESAARSKLQPLESKVPESALRHAPWVIPLTVVLLLLLFVALSSGGSQDSAEKELAEENPGTARSEKSSIPTAAAKRPSASAAPKPNGADEGSEPSASRWVANGSDKLASCEEGLGASAPKGRDPTRSSGYWKNARRLLMLGSTEEAIESMCLAGLLDPSGPASEGLAEYYLGQRALKQAERWIKESLKADPERRKSKELLGDIENQKGNVEEAKSLLLATLQLSKDDTKMMEVTARKLQKDARLARKGGDLPRAERELRRAALLAPKDAEIAVELGDVLLRREAPVTAASWAAHALQVDPNYTGAMILSARAAEALGKKDKAREFYEMVPLGDPYHAEAQQRRGRL